MKTIKFLAFCTYGWILVLTSFSIHEFFKIKDKIECIGLNPQIYQELRKTVK